MGWTVKGDFGDYTFADDITEEEALQYIEKVDKPAEWSQTLDPSRLGELTSIQAGRAFAGGARVLGDIAQPLLGENVLQTEARGFEKYAKERSQELAVPNQSIWQQGVESGLTSVPQVLPWVVGGSAIGALRGAGAAAGGVGALAKSFAEGAGIATTGMGAQTGLARYGDLREKGFDVGVSALAATWDGVVEKFTEYLPVKDLLNVTAPAGKWLYGFLTKELGGELAATTLQDLSAKLTDRPDMTLGDFAHDLAVTAIATPIGAGVQMGVMGPINLGIGAALTPPQQPVVAPPPPAPAEGKSVVVGRTGEPEGLFYSSAIGENAIALPKEGSRITQFTDPRVSERADDAPLARLVSDGTIPLSAPVRAFADMSQGRWADPVRAADLLGAIQLKNDGVEIAHFRNPETGATISLDLRKFDSNRAYKDLLAGTVPSGGKSLSLPQPVDPGDEQLKALETRVPVAPPAEPLAPPVPEAKPLHTTIKKTKTGKGVTINYSSDVQQRLFRIGEAKSRKGFIPPYLMAETLDLASDLGLPYDTVANLTVLYRNEVRGLAYNATVDEVQAPEISDDLINQAAPQGHNEVALPAGTVQLAAGLTPTPYTQRAVAQLKGWIRVFAPQMRIVVIAVGPSGSARPSGRADGAIYITLPPDGGTPIYQMFSLAHEFGHALTLHLLWRPEHRATLGRLKTEWEALKAKAPTMTVGQFLNEWASPWKIQRWGAQGSVKGIALSAPATELFKAQDAKTYTGYTLSFPEYAAEQVSRYVGKNDSISFAEDRTWFEEIVSKLREFFDRIVAKLKVQPEFERWLDSLTESALLENMATEELATEPVVEATEAAGWADINEIDTTLVFTSKVVKALKEKAKNGLVPRNEVIGQINAKGVKGSEKKLLQTILDELPGNKVDLVKMEQMVNNALLPAAPRVLIGGSPSAWWATYGVWQFSTPALDTRTHLYVMPFDLKYRNPHFSDVPNVFAHARHMDVESQKKYYVRVTETGPDEATQALLEILDEKGEVITSETQEFDSATEFLRGWNRKRMILEFLESKGIPLGRSRFLLELQSDFWNTFNDKWKTAREYIQNGGGEELPNLEPYELKEVEWALAKAFWMAMDESVFRMKYYNLTRSLGRKLGLSATDKVSDSADKITNIPLVMERLFPEMFADYQTLTPEQKDAVQQWFSYSQTEPKYKPSEYNDFIELTKNLEVLPRDWWQMILRAELTLAARQNVDAVYWPSAEAVSRVEQWPKITVFAEAEDDDGFTGKAVIENHILRSSEGERKAPDEPQNKADLPAKKYYERMLKQLDQLSPGDSMEIIDNVDHASIFEWYRKTVTPWVLTNFPGTRMVERMGSSWVEIPITPQFDSEVGFYDIAESAFADLPQVFSQEQKWGAARFIRSALYTFQINQLAKSFPGVPWITSIRDIFREMANYKNKLMEEPNLRIKEYYHLPVKTAEVVGGALREEFQNEVHWFDLKTNPDGSHEFVVSGVTLTLAKIKGLSEEAVEFMRRLKNDFMRMLDETEKVLLEGMQAHFAETPEILAEKEAELRAQFAEYRTKPYLPATRFGKYGVTVRAGEDVEIDGVKFKKGEVMSFERFDWKHQQQERVSALRAALPSHAIATSIIPDAVQAYTQLPFELVNRLVETLGERGLGLTPEQLEVLREVSFEGTKTGRFAKYLSQKVKGTAGASKDIRRVYAAYMWKMSNALSKLKHGWRLNRVLGDMRNTLTEMHKTGQSTDPLDLIYQRLVEQKDYVLQPQHEYQALRGAVSLWYLWGVPKTAIMNFTSTPILTYPYLWARFGAPKSLGTLMKAMKWAVQAWRDPKQFEENHPELMGVLNRGLADGVRDQSFAAMLAGASDANSLEMLLPNFDFARAQRLGDFGKKAMWRTIDAGMLPFRVVEKFNRDIALLATYQLNREAGKGVEESYAEAVAAVDATQNDYSSWNRSQLLQGPKSVALLFFSFIQNMSYLMYGGDKSWWRALLMMVMLGGILGLPGLENFLDVIDWAARKLLGKHVDLRQDAREYVAAMGVNPDIVLHGLSRAAPYDLSASIGAGRIIPGTEAIFGVGEFEQRFVAASGEIGGPVGALAVNVIRALADNNPNTWSMMDSLLPPALRNVQRGIEMIGYDAIRNRRGETVVPDPELSEIVGQFLGANALRKATTMEQQRHSYAASQYYAMRRTYLMGRLYMARKAGDSDTFISARERIADYNQKVPHRDLRISQDDIRRSLRTRARTSRLKEQGKPLSRRDRGLYSEISQGYPD